MDDVQGADVLAELRELRLRVAELEGRAAAEPPTEERSTRRGMLRFAGAAVIGGATASLVGTQPAAATVGNMQFGTSNDAETNSTTLTSTSSQTLGSICTSGGTGLQGSSTNNGTGVAGTLNSSGATGKAMWGNATGSLGFGLYGQGGAAQLRLLPKVGSVAPTSGAHLVGEVYSNDGGFFLCVANGSPGTWRKLGGPATAGAFHALTPSRVYDSRAAAPSPGILIAGANRTIYVGDKRDSNGAVVTPNLVPAGAIAVAANITVTGTTGFGGYLSVNPGDVTTSDSSTINWFGAGQNIANGVTLTLNATRQLTVVCGVGGGSTHVIIDVSGYYL